MARPGRPERNKAARSFRQLRRFHHVINWDKVFGTHNPSFSDAALIYVSKVDTHHAGVVMEFVTRAKKNNQKLIYCCDPVLGDSDPGLFVHAEIPPIFRDSLCPLANIITPNHFELEWLRGAKATTIDEVIKSARALSARGPSTVVVTGAQLADTPEDRIDTVAIEGSSVWRLSTPKLPIRPFGTGDLFSSVFVSSLVRGSDTRGALEDAVSATFAVLERTMAAGAEEMRIVESASMLSQRLCRFEAILFRA
jgi:pyridoxine kinase